MALPPQKTVNRREILRFFLSSPLESTKRSYRSFIVDVERELIAESIEDMAAAKIAAMNNPDIPGGNS